MMEKTSQFKIYRLCRDQKTISRFEEEGKKYLLPEQILVTGPDYFTFIEDVIRDCKEDYALLCHDDVIVPLDIADRVSECIAKADSYCGANKWGVVGNAGVEALSLRTVRFLKDPHTAVVPYKSQPIPVVSVDGNTTLLNIRNLRKKKVVLPSKIRGFHLYDFITLVECYRRGLFALVDSSLYVYHRSGGAQGGFDEFASGAEFQEYWKQNFINHRIHTINGPVDIKNPDLEYLKEGSRNQRADFYDLVKKLLLTIEPKLKPTLNIIARTQLRNPDSLQRLIESVRISGIANHDYLSLRMILSVNNVKVADPEKVIEGLKHKYEDVDLTIVSSKPSGSMKPRMKSIHDALDVIQEGENQFVWVVDDDDFIFPKELRLVSKYLNKDNIFIGRSEPFEEKWADGKVTPVKSTAKPGFYNEISYARNYLGDNHVPICSAIFPEQVLRDVFRDHKLAGDYYEDYTLIFLAQARNNIQYLPLLIAGVSHHDEQTIFEKDRTHWDYSYTTFLSEITNSGVVNNSVFELNSTLDNYLRNYKSGRFLLALASGKIKNILSLLLRLKIRSLINTLRSYL